MHISDGYLGNYVVDGRGRKIGQSASRAKCAAYLGCFGFFRGSTLGSGRMIRASLALKASSSSSHPSSRAISRMRWSPRTGQVAKRESPLGAAGWPEVRHDQYSEEARA